MNKKIVIRKRCDKCDFWYHGKCMKGEECICDIAERQLNSAIKE